MKKQKDKKMTLDRLASLMQQGFEKNQEEMAIMVNTAVQGTQDLLIEKIDQLGKKIDGVDKNVKAIHHEVQKINLNIVDVVRKEDFDKLENRVVDLEEARGLRLKKA